MKVLGAAFKGEFSPPPPKTPPPPFPPLHQTVPHRCSHTRPFLISSAVIVYLSLGKQDSSCPNITSDRQAEEFC